MRHVLLLLFLLGPAFTAAANYRLQIGNVLWNGSPGGYNCFSSSEYPNTVNFFLTKTKPGNRSYAVTAGPSANTGDYQRQLAAGTDRLNYQLYTSSARSFILKAPPTATPGEVISGGGNDREGTVIPLSFTFNIPPNQLVLPGTYTDQITVSIYDRYNDNGAPFDTRTITFTVVVAAGASLSLVPSGSGFSSHSSQNMNFGSLSQGQNLGCDLLVRKNAGCSLAFSSRNGGVMKMIPTPTADQVPYSCTVSGNPLPLANPAQINLPAGVSPSQDGNRLPVRITIGDLGSAAAGDYQDEITITLVAN